LYDDEKDDIEMKMRMRMSSSSHTYNPIYGLYEDADEDEDIIFITHIILYMDYVCDGNDILILTLIFI